MHPLTVMRRPAPKQTSAAAVPAGPTAGWIGVYADGATDADRVPITWIDTSDLPGNGGGMTYTPPTVDGEANVLAHLTV